MKQPFPFYLFLAFFLSLTPFLWAQVPAANQPLAFATTPDPALYPFQRSLPTDPYLLTLRDTHQLDKLVAGQPTDLARVQAVCAWVHRQWKHDGYRQPQKWDPASILQEAAQGKSFRCVEYSIVLEGALTAVGIPARTLGLQTVDVETRKSGAGHVLTEAWLADQQKWALVDGQWDVIPLLQGTPLNAVELQKALAERSPGLSVISVAGTSAKKYARWIRPYLFYFAVSFDSRVGGKKVPGELMLVPLGAKNPMIFQRRYPIQNTTYTHSLVSFYASPR